MIDRLAGNPVGKVLAWISAGLVAVLLVLTVVWALPPSGSVGEAADSDRGLSSNVPQLGTARPIEEYAEITNRPVFNQSRQPVIGVTANQEEEEDPAEIENVDAPEVELAGVVITPELRVATLRLKDSPESLMAFEGQPLEGDFGSWRLSRIEPRMAVLESGSGEKVNLELQIHDAVIDEPVQPPENGEPAVVTDVAEQEQANDQPMTRAEEIRQRIQQRREELKRAAEEGRQAEPPPKVDYREAIQSMMVGRKDQEEDDSEQ